MSKDIPTHTTQHLFPNGITIAEFKRIVAGWPEVDEAGKQNTVWAYDDAGRAGRVRKIEAEAMTSKGGKFDLTLNTDGRP